MQIRSFLLSKPMHADADGYEQVCALFKRQQEWLDSRLGAQDIKSTMRSSFQRVQGFAQCRRHFTSHNGVASDRAFYKRLRNAIEGIVRLNSIHVGVPGQIGWSRFLKHAFMIAWYSLL